MRQRFPVGTTVWCLWDGSQEFAARVLAHDEKRGEFRYKVHYFGWNSRYDEWVAESQMRVNKSTVNVSPNHNGPIKYSPEREVPKKSKKRVDEDKSVTEKAEIRPPAPKSRKIEVLAEIPPAPKRSKGARPKYSPPPKPLITTVPGRRGRPPKNPPTTSTSSGRTASPARSISNPLMTSSSKHSLYNGNKQSSKSRDSSASVLSPSTVRRRKRGRSPTLSSNGSDRVKEESIDNHPGEVMSPTSSHVLSVAYDLHMTYGVRMMSPVKDSREAIAKIVEQIKMEDKWFRRRRFENYLRRKKEMAVAFEKYLTPTTSVSTRNSIDNGQKNDVTATESAPTEAEPSSEEPTPSCEAPSGAPAPVANSSSVDEEKTNVAECIVKRTPTPPSVPTITTTSPTVTESSNDISRNTVNDAASAAATVPLSVATTNGTTNGIDPSSSSYTPPLPQNLKPNPNVPQDQSYAHIPFVGAETGRAIVTQLKAERANAIQRGGGGGPTTRNTRSYMMAGNAIRTVSSSIANGGGTSKMIGRPTLFVAPSNSTTNGNHKQSLLVQPKKLIHESDVLPTYYGSPSTSNGGRTINGKAHTEYYATSDSGNDQFEYIDDFAQDVAEEIVVTDSGEIEDTRPSTSSYSNIIDRSMKNGGGTNTLSMEVRADHCYGVANTNKGKQQYTTHNHHLHSPPLSNTSSSSSPSSASGPSMAITSSPNGGPVSTTVQPHIRQRMVVPRLYSTVQSTVAVNGRPVMSMASSCSGGGMIGASGQPVYIGVRQNANNSNVVSRTIRFRPATGGAPILQSSNINGNNGGNLRLVDSRRFRPVYVQRGNNGASTQIAMAAMQAPTRVTPAGVGGTTANASASRINGGGTAPMRRVAYITPPMRTRMVIPKVNNTPGGMTMASARDGISSISSTIKTINNAAASSPPVLIPQTSTTDIK